MSKVNILVASVLLLFAAASQAAEVVGKVGYMSGSLVAKRADGTVKIMGTKADVLAGDVLGTAKNSYAQIQMNDGSKMTLRPDSNLKIVEYQFNKQEPQSDSAVFDLIKGGLRSVTGLISKRGNPDAYKIQTKVATVGIRGTDFSTRLCATPNCQDDAAASAQPAGKPQVMPPQQVAGGAPPPPAAGASPPGLYVTVHSGQVIVAQPTGNTLNLGRGETGFANQAALIRLPAPPAFMNADTKQTNAIEAKAAKAEEKAANKADDGKANSKQDKEKADSKPDEEKKDGKADKEKADSKPDEEKKDGKADKDKDSAKPEGEKADSKADEGKSDSKTDGGKAESKSDEGKADSKPDGGNAASKSDEGNAAGGSNEVNDTINPNGGNAASTDPTVNQSGCVVQ
ncbi:MAG: FecR domain-containing protein [Gallionella sp.]|nr:FecR domain-containing protein [Gallionella sp.]